MTNGSMEQPSSGLEYLNEFAENMGEIKAKELRKGAISLVYTYVTQFLQEDTEANRLRAESPNPDEVSINKYLQIDVLASPGLQVSEFKDALWYQLVRVKERAPGETFGADRIKVFLPIDKDFHLGTDPSTLPEADEIEEVYVMFEKDKLDGTHTRRFAIPRDREVYEYVAPNDPDRESEISDIFDRDIHDMETDTQRLNNLMLIQLVEDHRNFAKVYQATGRDF